MFRYDGYNVMTKFRCFDGRFKMTEIPLFRYNVITTFYKFLYSPLFPAPLRGRVAVRPGWGSEALCKRCQYQI